jgi:hypothetical protein
MHSNLTPHLCQIHHSVSDHHGVYLAERHRDRWLTPPGWSGCHRHPPRSLDRIRCASHKYKHTPPCKMRHICTVCIWQIVAFVLDSERSLTVHCRSPHQSVISRGLNLRVTGVVSGHCCSCALLRGIAVLGLLCTHTLSCQICQI